MTVYFAMGLSTGRIKIGVTRVSIAKRLTWCRWTEHETFVLLATYPGGRRVEAWWHRRHAATGERGYGKGGPGTGRLTELFKPTPLLLRDIVELIDLETTQ